MRGAAAAGWGPAGRTPRNTRPPATIATPASTNTGVWPPAPLLNRPNNAASSAVLAATAKLRTPSARGRSSTRYRCGTSVAYCTS